MKIIIIILLLLTSCQSLDLRDSGGTIVTTTVAYASGGIVPAIAVAGANITYDAIIEKEKNINEIENTPQAVAYIADAIITNTVIGIIIFLICATFCKTWIANTIKFLKNLFRKHG